jgi:hypothetical protein
VAILNFLKHTVIKKIGDLCSQAFSNAEDDHFLGYTAPCSLIEVDGKLLSLTNKHN